MAFNRLFFLVLIQAIAALKMPRGNSEKQQNVKSTVSPDWAGNVAPTGYFDPLRFSSTASDEDVKKWREAELKHGRVCMLASVGILTQEAWHPLFGGNIHGPAIYHFQQVENVFHPFWYLTLLGTGIIEGYGIAKGWGPMSANGIADLKDEYVPGDLSFDPLGFRPAGSRDFNNLSDEFKNIRTKELQNGRLAMLGTAGMVLQELVDNRPILEHLKEFGLRYAPAAASAVESLN